MITHPYCITPNDDCEFSARNAHIQYTLALDGWIVQPGYIGKRAVARKLYRCGADLVLPRITPRPIAPPRFSPPMVKDRARVVHAAGMLLDWLSEQARAGGEHG